MLHKAVFLDRDGTVIKDTNHVTKISQVKLLPKAAVGIKLFKNLGYKVIVVSNQSAVARGYITKKELSAIDRHFRRLLLVKGIKLDAVYYCPHLAEGIVKRYSIECDCRKPKPGLLIRAIKKHKIDLSKSVMIGDSIRDVLAGRAAGVKTILVKNLFTDPKVTKKADVVVSNLLEAGKIFRAGFKNGHKVS